MYREDAKPWLAEGLAVYFESSVLKYGRLQTGIIPTYRLIQLKEALKKNRALSLRDLLSMGQERFGSLEYAQSWSFVYFILHAYQGKNRKYFIQYFQRLRDGKTDGAKLFQEIFKCPIDEMEVHWKKYVMAL